MPDPSAQQFLNELDRKLWAAADKLRASLDAAVYKHAVLGLIFLKYVSDSFAVRQNEIETQLRNLPFNINDGQRTPRWQGLGMQGFRE